MNRIHADRISQLYDCLFTCGWLTIPEPDPLINYINKGINNFEIQPEQKFLCNGFPIIYNQSFTEFNRIEVTSTNSPPDLVFDDSLGVCPPGPSPSTHECDLIFMEFWFEEVRDADTIYRYGNIDHYNPAFFTNDIIDPAVGLPAAVRVQLRYRTRIVAGAELMDCPNVYIQGKKSTPDMVRHFEYDDESRIWFHDTTTTADIGEFDDVTGIVWAAPIVATCRTVGDDDMNNAVFTDLREKVCQRVSTFIQNPAVGCNILEFPGQIITPEVVDVVDSLDEVTVDWCDSNVHFIDLDDASGDVTLTLENPEPGGVYYIIFKQHLTTPVQVIFPGDVDFLANVPFELSSEPGDVDIVVMIRSANPTYRAFGWGKFTFAIPPCQEDVTVVGGTQTLDWKECPSWRLFLSPTGSDPVTLTLDNPEAGGVYSVKLVQGPTPIDVVWPGNVDWLSGEEFVLSDSPNDVDIVVLYYDGVNYCAEGIGVNSQNFLGLTDTPDSYSGQGTRILKVNGAETEVEFGADLDDLDNADESGKVSNVSFLMWNGSNWVPNIAVKSVTGIGDITVDNTDPSNPTVTVVGGIASFAPIQSLIAGTDISITNPSGPNPTINSTASGGEVNTGANVGVGTGEVFRDKTSATLNFKRLQAGANVTVTDNANEIIIASTGGGGVASVTGVSPIVASPTTGAVVVSLAATSVGTGFLDTSTASQSITTITGNVTMNDFSFFPNISTFGTFSDKSGTFPLISSLGGFPTVSVVGGTVGRCSISHPATPDFGSGTTVFWRFVNP